MQVIADVGTSQQLGHSWGQCSHNIWFYLELFTSVMSLYQILPSYDYFWYTQESKIYIKCYIVYISRFINGFKVHEMSIKKFEKKTLIWTNMCCVEWQCCIDDACFQQCVLPVHVLSRFTVCHNSLNIFTVKASFQVSCVVNEFLSVS